MHLGDTHSVVGMYQLLAGLRGIADWMDRHFLEWFTLLLEDAVAAL